MLHPTLRFKRLENGLDLPLPSYQTGGAAGMDVHSAVDIKIWPNGDANILKTGLAVEIPAGYELQVRSRGGLASRGVFVTNGPGTIDADYRGEIMVLLTYVGRGNPIEIKRGDRIAQLVLTPVCRPFDIIEVDELSSTDRGEGRFSSTGR